MKAARSPSVRTLEPRRDAWIRKLAEVGPLTRGSRVTARRGGHLAHQLTVSVKGKTRTVYVPADALGEIPARLVAALILACRFSYMISQLILHGSLIRSLARTFGSARNFARRLAESLRNRLVPEHLPLPGPIRFKPP